MAKSPIDLLQLESGLKLLGLKNFGQFCFTADHCTQERSAFIGRNAALIGNAGPDMWQKFRVSPEFCDGKSDPMNRWTQRNVIALANAVGVEAVFPFDIPYWPFQRFAQSALGIKSSPLGLLIHPEFGLWHAFRAVVIAPEGREFLIPANGLAQKVDELIHPCENCIEKPCLQACPVDAFDGVSLKRDACLGHLDAAIEPDCMSIGCRARDACPVGQPHRYSPEQIAFHMTAFRG